MRTPPRFLTLGLLSAAAVLLVAGTAEAQFRGYLGRPLVRRPVYPPNRMPGWDWWRTYPWSPYNYGRNPYNPIVVPYPYVQPYPYPVYQPYVMQVPSAGGRTSAYYGPADSLRLPQPTAPLGTPPPNEGAIRMYLPDTFTEVWFDGEKTSSIGDVRYYVTPELRKEKDYHYDVKIRWNRGGQPVTADRRVTVRAGQTTIVDFTRPSTGG